MAHEGKRHYTDGRNDPREIGKSPTVALTRTANQSRLYDYIVILRSDFTGAHSYFVFGK